MEIGMNQLIQKPLPLNDFGDILLSLNFIQKFPEHVYQNY